MGGLRDPNLALWLYLAIAVTQLLFSKRWLAFYDVVRSAGSAKAAASSGSAAAEPGQHGL